MLNLAMSEEAELAAASARDDRLQRLDGSGGSLNTSLEGVQLASPRGGRIAEEPREAVQLATGTLLRQRAATETAALPLGAAKGCFWELYSPEWAAFLAPGPSKPPTRPSLCHPWSSGVTA